MMEVSIILHSYKGDEVGKFLGGEKRWRDIPRSPWGNGHSCPFIDYELTFSARTGMSVLPREFDFAQPRFFTDGQGLAFVADVRC